MADYVEQMELRSDQLARGTRARVVWELNARLLRGAEIVKAALVDSIRDMPLTLNEYYTLMLVSNHPRGQLSHTALAEQTFASTSTITHRVDGLEARGLVRRVPDPRDRRAMLVEITADGREMAMHTGKRVTDMHGAWLARFDDRELERLNQCLRELLEVLDESGAFESGTSGRQRATAVAD